MTLTHRVSVTFTGTENGKPYRKRENPYRSSSPRLLKIFLYPFVCQYLPQHERCGRREYLCQGLKLELEVTSEERRRLKTGRSDPRIRRSKKTGKKIQNLDCFQESGKNTKRPESKGGQETKGRSRFSLYLDQDKVQVFVQVHVYRTHCTPSFHKTFYLHECCLEVVVVSHDFEKKRKRRSVVWIEEGVELKDLTSKHMKATKGS